jgi:hypothetical protein
MDVKNYRNIAEGKDWQNRLYPIAELFCIFPENVLRMNLSPAFFTADIPIGCLIEPEEIAQLADDLYKNEGLAGEVYFCSGGLRLGSR